MRQDQTYQGTESVAAETSDTDRARTWDATEIESAKRYLCRLNDFHYDANVTRESCTPRGDDPHGSRFCLTSPLQVYIIPFVHKLMKIESARTFQKEVR